VAVAGSSSVCALCVYNAEDFRVVSDVKGLLYRCDTPVPHGQESG
jgi:hypothetical protein